MQASKKHSFLRRSPLAYVVVPLAFVLVSTALVFIVGHTMLAPYQALLGWFLLPFPLEYRQALVMCTLAPIASTAPAFTAELKGDFGLSSAVNSISILISIVLITGSLLLILV